MMIPDELKQFRRIDRTSKNLLRIETGAFMERQNILGCKEKNRRKRSCLRWVLQGAEAPAKGAKSTLVSWSADNLYHPMDDSSMLLCSSCPCPMSRQDPDVLDGVRDTAQLKETIIVQLNGAVSRVRLSAHELLLADNVCVNCQSDLNFNQLRQVVDPVLR